jgi:hypothetical protein
MSERARGWFGRPLVCEVQRIMQPKHAPKDEDQPLPQENDIQFHKSSDVNYLPVFMKYLLP